jgi:uncharacterized protein YqhQ
MSKELLGGQALIEGVMMKSKKKIAYAVYNPKGKLITKTVTYKGLAQRYPVLGLPLIRGFVNLCEMMSVGMKAIEYSTSIAMPEEKQTKADFVFSIFVALLFSVGLFIVVPAGVFTYFKPYIANTVFLNLIEGLTRISIFLIFLSIMTLSKDMRRVFSYHGAEHMTVYAYEANDKLTVERIKKYSTLHPRCGTSFMLVVLIVSIIVFSFLGRPDMAHRVVYKLGLLPIIAGVSYEVIRLVCRLPKFFMYAVLWPGLLVQLLTTRRPDNKMIQAAITALRNAGGN